MKIIANPLLANSNVRPAIGPGSDFEYIERKIKHASEVIANFSTIVKIGIDQVSLHDHDKIVDDVKDHRADNRHHYLCSHPEKMNCIDLIEACCDVVSVAMTKGGEAEVPLRDDIFDNVMIRSIVENTCALLNSSVRVKFFKASTYE